MNNQHPWRIARFATFAVALVALVLVWPQSVRADGGAPNLAYIAGAGTDSQALAVVDIGQRKETGHVDVGGSPWGVVLSPDGRYAYVTQSAKNSLAIVEAHGLTVTKTIPLGKQPQALAIDLTLAPKVTLYAINTGENTVSVVDPDAAQPILATVTVGQHPTGVAVASASSGISDPSRPEIYVASADDNTVTILDGNHHTVLATVPVPGGPLSISVPALGGVAYVATRTGAIDGIALADHRFLGTILQRDGAKYGLMDYDAITQRVYVADANGGLVVLSPATAGGAGSSIHIPTEPARVLNYSGGPSAVAITFDGSYGFVASHDTGQVAMFDVGARSTLATITVGGTPNSVITGSYPPVLDRQTAYIAEFVISGLILVVLGVLVYVIWRRSQKGSTTRAVDTQTIDTHPSHT